MQSFDLKVKVFFYLYLLHNELHNGSAWWIPQCLFDVSSLWTCTFNKHSGDEWNIWRSPSNWPSSETPPPCLPYLMFTWGVDHFLKTAGCQGGSLLAMRLSTTTPGLHHKMKCLHCAEDTQSFFSCYSMPPSLSLALSVCHCRLSWLQYPSQRKA